MSGYHKKANQSIEKDLFMDQLTLADLRQAVKGRFHSFCTAVGLQALMTLMEQDVEAVAGPKGKHNPDRTAYRHGYQKTTIPMDNQRVDIKRPRVRTTDTDEELPIPSYETFNNDEQLLDAALNRMLYGMSTRDYNNGISDYSDVAETSSTSKSVISQRFIKASAEEAKKLLTRRLDGLVIPIIMIDGIVRGDYTAIVVLGITDDGQKIMLGVRIGSTENSIVCRDLLTDLNERGLDYEQGILAVIDGSKALRKALKDVYGDKVLVQRCQVHKERNILGYLPKYKHDWIKRKLKKAWTSQDATEAIRKLRSLSNAIQHDYPDAAASLREGLEETVTILKLKLPALLRRSLRSTNCIESAFSLASKNMKNVKNWKNGSMVQRWICTALLDAERRSNRIAGYRSMGILIAEIKRLTIVDEMDDLGKESTTA